MYREIKTFKTFFLKKNPALLLYQWFFFFFFLGGHYCDDVAKVANDPLGDLARFGYKLNVKVKFLNLFLYFWLLT